MNFTANNILDEEIAPTQLKQWMEEGEVFTLVDIREPRERDFAKLDDDEWIPMGDLPQKVNELGELESPIILYCHHGQRSYQAAQFLLEQDLSEIYSLAGGIHQWSVEIDPEIPRY